LRGIKGEASNKMAVIPANAGIQVVFLILTPPSKFLFQKLRGIKGEASNKMAVIPANAGIQGCFPDSNSSL
jgi:hypothetical protein